MIQITYGRGSKTGETCLWILDGKREICLTYEFDHETGRVRYAASVYRKTSKDYVLTDDEVRGHCKTTTRRYEMRPVEFYTDPFTPYCEILGAIRHQMCHGAGCKGLRSAVPRSTRAGDSWEHEESDSGSSCGRITPDTDAEDAYVVADRTHRLKTVRRVRYIETDKDGIHRDVFITFKGSKSTGDVLYGAAIHRSSEYFDHPLTEEEVESHFQTAEGRLSKSPVHMNVDAAYRSQLGKKARHREDVMYKIVDNIFTRRQGMIQVSGSRHVAAASA